MKAHDFAPRHIGPREDKIEQMLKAIGEPDLASLCQKAIPANILKPPQMDIPPAASEYEALRELNLIAKENKNFRSYIGTGYYGTRTPAVILRNVLESPGWYTQYTPYQSEISQGRLEALLNFQTMICDLTGLEISNASLLDESTAAAEAMALAYHARKNKSARTLFVAEDCHPQTIKVLQTRAQPIDIDVQVGKLEQINWNDEIFAVIMQYPNTYGNISNLSDIIKEIHEHNALAVTCTDLMALTLIASPGTLGADMAVGSSQRFGVPMGFGGPHAAFFATREKFKRQIPGRLVGVSKDRDGNLAYRLALQTREQHIRRERATSNICTAQVLLAIMASMYAVYHGPKGLRSIATEINTKTNRLAAALKLAGYKVLNTQWFDTLTVALEAGKKSQLQKTALKNQMNMRWELDGAVGISLDEVTTEIDLENIFKLFDLKPMEDAPAQLNSVLRQDQYLTHPVFHRYRSETEMMRYILRLQAKDLSLTTSMISLGSCTMKLNAAAEMIPVSWKEFAHMHPFAPDEQTIGYRKMMKQLEHWLCQITGLAACSLQPNAGSQGEYAGLLAIRAYHQKNSQQRDICLIPSSAHGTNPASAVMAGMKVVVVGCDANGNIDVADLQEKAQQHKYKLAALMVTYPSTHGVFETAIQEICQIIHDNGGQVYLDGANMNAQVGLCQPGAYGIDVCHLNLHKTFCIPHGGGGPGVGPICVAPHLKEFLPGEATVGAVSAAHFGSPSILPISWMYIRMMGAEGLKKATEVALLNANYIAHKLDSYFPVLFRGESGYVAHECILDLRPCEKQSGVKVEDVAKRLIDYGFHAPTMSWPVAGTLMVEPTESESLAELDRFCQAMVSIHKEIQESPLALKNAPHPAHLLTTDQWDHTYSREKAVFPLPWVQENKFWPPVSRVDNAYGDKNLMCSCPADWQGEPT